MIQRYKICFTHYLVWLMEMQARKSKTVSRVEFDNLVAKEMYVQRDWNGCLTIGFRTLTTLSHQKIILIVCMYHHTRIFYIYKQAPSLLVLLICAKYRPVLCQITLVLVNYCFERPGHFSYCVCSFECARSFPMC